MVKEKRNQAIKPSFLSDSVIEELYAEVQKLYLADSRPWVVGYSGGKDSTSTLQILWKAIEALPNDNNWVIIQ